jgi:hypothetical protein
MAFHERKGVVVVLIEQALDPALPPVWRKGQTETWTYHPDADAWSRIDGATLPFACGMNYNLHYDPLHNVLLLVTDTADGFTSVWALKLRIQ